MYDMIMMYSTEWKSFKLYDMEIENNLKLSDRFKFSCPVYFLYHLIYLSAGRML